MKIKEGYILKSVAGANLIVPVGGTRFESIMTLNETGVVLFKLLANGADVSALADALCEAYEVDRSTAESDAAAFAASLKNVGILDE